MGMRRRRPAASGDGSAPEADDAPSSSSDTHAEEREHAEDSERGAETNGEERRGASMQKNKAEDESVAVDLRIVLATVLAFALRTWDIGYPPVVV